MGTWDTIEGRKHSSSFAIQIMDVFSNIQVDLLMSIEYLYQVVSNCKPLMFLRNMISSNLCINYFGSKKITIGHKFYSLCPNLLGTFDKNKNTKKSVRNLQKCPTRTYLVLN
jgi:hypothetical protein